MLIDLHELRMQLAEAPQEYPLDTSELNPYLVKEVLAPLLVGKTLRYGDIDFTRFEAVDVYQVKNWYGELESIQGTLQGYLQSVGNAPPDFCNHRAFC